MHSSAAQASVCFGFGHANLARLIALAVPENIASRRVMEHLGFAYESDARYFGLDRVCYALERDRFHRTAVHLMAPSAKSFTQAASLSNLNV
jgi:RimJ/RimL family protein N-acetyltransferase